MELKVRVHAEEGTYWAEVEELPGCFASGQSLDELVEALTEAISMYLQEEPSGSVNAEREDGQPLSMQVDELRVKIPGGRPEVPA